MTATPPTLAPQGGAESEAVHRLNILERLLVKALPEDAPGQPSVAVALHDLRASLAAPASAQEAPAGWQVRAIGCEGGPGKWRHADECDLDAYRNGPDMWELRPVFASPSAAVQQGEALLTDDLLEIGRKAIEDALVEWRDERLSQPMRGNGLVIRERDGRESSMIRFGPEDALRIGIKAMIAALASAQPKTGESNV